MTPTMEATRFAQWSFRTGEVREIRCPHSRVSGWCDDAYIAAGHAVELADDGEPAVYITLNPVRPNFVRSQELNKILSAGTTTSDRDTARLVFLFLDFDPVRSNGDKSDAATDDERFAALSRAYDVREHLADLGWPRPALLWSGNGVYLLFTIDLDPSDVQLVKAVTKGLSLRFSDDLVKIDDAVWNPSRIIRFPGSWNRKGPGTEERPHRRAENIELPERVTVSREQLVAMVESLPKPPEPQKRPAKSVGTVSPVGGELRVGDDFNARGDDLADMLEPAGWTLCRAEVGKRAWTRPGKTTGVSATEYFGGFYVFSSSASPFEVGWIDRFGVYARLLHGGDFGAATRALAARGFGSKPAEVDLSGILGKLKSKPSPNAELPVLPVDPPDERELVELDDYRRLMLLARMGSACIAALYADFGGTGLGKSTADQLAIFQANILNSLSAYPAHSDANEVAAAMLAMGLDAKAWPQRITAGIGLNCWNDDANRAEGMGLSVSQAVCPGCSMRQTCGISGFMRDAKDAEKAHHQLMTHARLVHAGPFKACRGKELLSIHENCIPVLRPMLKTTLEDIKAAQPILNRMLSDPVWINRLSETGDDADDLESDGQRIEYIRAIAETVDALSAAMEAATDPVTRWSPIATSSPSSKSQIDLFQATRESKVRFDLSPWPALMAMVDGRCKNPVIRIDEKQVSAEETVADRRLIAVLQTELPADLPVWLADATADPQTLEKLAGRPIQDATPPGRVAMKQPILQYPVDITRRTTPEIVQSRVRGLLAQRPKVVRLGVISHSCHVAAIEGLSPRWRNRIGMISYFGSGLDRSSNAWIRECDAIAVLGTPRVNPSATRDWLIQVGEIEAAERNPEWVPFIWEGRTATGAIRRVTSAGYMHDADWRKAHAALVGSTIIQAAGRGRGVLENGVPVWLLSTEKAGFTLAEDDGITLNDTESTILDAVDELTAISPILNNIGHSAVSTNAIADRQSLSQRQCRDVLARLSDLKLIERIGARSGWRSITST